MNIERFRNPRLKFFAGEFWGKFFGKNAQMLQFGWLAYGLNLKVATRQKVKWVDYDRANLDYANKHASNKEILN